MIQNAADISRQWEYEFRSGTPSEATVRDILTFVTRWVSAWALARSVQMTGPDREDIASDTVERAYRLVDQFDGRSQFTTWLIGIARNAAREHVRHNRMDAYTKSSYDVGAAVAAPGNMESQIVRSVWVGEAFGCLSAYQRKVMTMRYFERLSNAEISSELGKSTNAIQQVVQGALEKLGRWADRNWW